MTTENIYRFPAPNGVIATLTPVQYDALVGKGKLTPGMLHRVLAAALLLEHVVPGEVRSLNELSAAIVGDPDALPTNMLRRAMVALVRSGLVRQTGAGNATRYILPGGE